MASRPQFFIPPDVYLVIGEKKFMVEYPQKFILIWKQAVYTKRW